MHITRKKLVSLGLIVFMMISVMLPLQVSAADYSGLDWAKSTIDSFIARKIIKADANGNIEPNKLLTRAEMAAVINKAFGFTKTSEINYSDVQKTDSYYKDLQIAKGAGYMKGDTQGTFRPNAPISRQEMSIIVARILELEPNISVARNYKDFDKISSDEARGAIGAMSMVNVLKGVGGNLFDPLSSITRAQAYVMVERSEKVYLELKDGTRKYANVTVTGGKNLGGEDNVKNYNNVSVSGNGTVLKNIVIHGDLTIMASVGDGDVTLENVTVKGKTYIYGGGKNSIKANNSKFATITIDKKIAGETARLVLSGSSAVDQIVAKSGVTIESDAKIKIPNVTIPKDAPKESIVTISATIGELTIQATVKVTLSGNAQIEVLSVSASAAGASVSIDAGSVIGQALLNAAVAVTGKGQIVIAVVNADGVELGNIVATVVDNAGNDSGNSSSSSGSSSSSDSGSNSGGDNSSGGNYDGGYIPPYVDPVANLIAAFNNLMHNSAPSNASFTGTSSVTISTDSGSALQSQALSFIANLPNEAGNGIYVTNISYGGTPTSIPASVSVTVTFTNGTVTATQSYSVTIERSAPAQP